MGEGGEEEEGGGEGGFEGGVWVAFWPELFVEEVEGAGCEVAGQAEDDAFDYFADGAGRDVEGVVFRVRVRAGI